MGESTMRIWLREPHAGQLWIRRLWSSAQLTPPRPVGSGATCVLLSHSLHCSVYTPLFFSWSRLSVPENQFCLLHFYIFHRVRYTVAMQWSVAVGWFTGEQITLGQQVEKVLSPGFIKRQSHSSVDGTAYSSGCA